MIWPGAIPKTVEAYCYKPYELTVLFGSGEKKVLDIEQYIDKDEELKILKQRPKLFKKVEVSPCGYMVYWDTGKDYVWFHCDYVYVHGKPLVEPSESDAPQQQKI